MQSLYLELAIGIIFILDEILQESSQVQDLSVHVAFRLDEISVEAFDNWLQNVKQISLLKELTIKGACRCDLVEYLVYKYPNINNVYLDTINRDVPWDRFPRRVFMDSATLYRIAGLMLNISTYGIKFILNRGSTLRAIQQNILQDYGKYIISGTEAQDVTYYNPTVRGPEMKRTIERIHHLVVKSNN